MGRTNRFEIRTEGDRWIWVLHAGYDPKPGELARSGRSYKTKAGAKQAAMSLERRAWSAEIVEGEPG